MQSLLAGSVGELRVERGQVLENLDVELCGRVLARRDQSSAITFLELGPAEGSSSSSSSDRVQACVNRRRCTAASSLRALAEAHVGDVVRCCGHPGRTRTGNDADSLSLFPRDFELIRVGLAPVRLLALLSSVRRGLWSMHEAAPLLACEPSLVAALLQLLQEPLEKHLAAAAVQAQQPEAAEAVAAKRARQRPARMQRVAEVASRRQGGLLLVMECITHPTNVAAMLRTCDAFGIAEAALVSERRLEPSAAELRRASASASLWVQLHHFTDTDACAAMLRDRGFHSVGTALRPGSSRALGADLGLLQPRLAIWVGNEAHGLSEAAICCCDETLYVPMAGMVESLNVAACAAVVVAEACRSAAP